jgi:hypothetical protein
MNHKTCDYPDREDVIVTYLYDDLDDRARSAFDAHLSACAACRAEVGGLRIVRRQLGQWEAPAVADRQPPVVDPQWPVLNEPASWWRDVPAWARAAAAVVCLGAGAGLANLDVRYDSAGLAVRTGWMGTLTSQPPAAGTRQPAVAGPPAPVANPDAAPWRAELAALERQLRTEFRAGVTAAPQTASVQADAPSMTEAELLRRMRALVDESERRQERELALRVGQMMRSVEAQRRADLQKIDSNLGLIQSNTGAEVMRQRQLLMNYLVRVSSQK